MGPPIDGALAPLHAPSMEIQPRPSPVALVTGAGRGIGRCIAGHLALAGHFVVFSDVDEAAAQAAAAPFAELACAMRVDVRAANDVVEATRRIVDLHGALDVMVNNAGLMTQGPYQRTTSAEFEQMLAVNVGGLFHCVQAVSPHMKARGRGLILNIASVSSVRGGGAVGNIWYGGSKAAVVAMTAGLARELGPHGIRVNAISPGLVETDMVREFLTPELRERVIARFPLGRLSTVEDVARMAVFLASDAAAFVTGQTIAVDGGFLTN